MWAAPYRGEDSLAVIEVSSIISVVGMIPHDFDTPTTVGVQTLCLFEKLGAERDWVGDMEESLDDDEEDDEEGDEDDLD